MIDAAPRARRCSYCRRDDHDIRRCPDVWRGVAPPPGHETTEERDERTTAIAELREEIDAMAIECTQYADAIVALQERVAQNRDRIAAKTLAIGRLRGGR